ncbi:MAG: hypothetical protein J0I41_15590 [Filimonas sp.]|nr:hypothetical protein [Filimonas sp.]
MDQTTSSSYKAFGIASLVLGILAFVFSFIPCLGVYAMFPGIVGIILGIIGFVQANKAKGAKGMVIAGTILSLLGTAVAYTQYKALKHAVTETTKALETINQSMDSSLKAIDSVKKANDSAINELDKTK